MLKMGGRRLSELQKLSTVMSMVNICVRALISHHVPRSRGAGYPLDI
jgi:hypothetical protein